MDKNKTILFCTISIVIGICVSLVVFFYYKYRGLEINNSAEKLIIISKETSIKEREMKLMTYNSHIYCLRSVMNDNKNNNRPCNIKEAERICKFEK